jgi:hypothetical protein
MSFGKAATLFFILCMLTQLLFAENTEFTELKNLNEKEHRYHESINVLFTYRAPKNFSKGDKLFLYFIIVNLADGEENLQA